MGFSESSNGCKIHPNHHDKHGVCPSCLRERLSSLNSIDSYKQISLSFSPYIKYYSASTSIPTSPARQDHDSHKRNGPRVPKGITRSSSSSCTVKFGANGIKKSRSIAFLPRNLDEEEEEKEVEDGKKEKGFWSKLLRFKGKKNKDVLRHSKSMRLIEGENMVLE
ncbi:hypothetical protein HRI_004537700 [Hibiscus trionum]|uniref:Uncharacterized protein n=1 Tax=Hibiscus trionum TaxID=183268 RepID=A0A9W7J7B8_HIBTR|nr:hypothetical protein HRI_004537700 [Hibiscus trionum]